MITPNDFVTLSAPTAYVSPGVIVIYRRASASNEHVESFKKALADAKEAAAIRRRAAVLVAPPPAHPPRRLVLAQRRTEARPRERRTAPP